MLRDLGFLEIGHALEVASQQCLLLEGDSVQYDIVFGRDFLHAMGMSLDFEDCKMQWQGREVPMKSKETPFALHFADEDDETNDEEFFVSEILSRKYEAVDLDTLVQNQVHLNNELERALRIASTGNDELFYGNLVYKGK